MVDVSAYTPGDGFILACNLREQDRAELDASGWRNHHAAVLQSVRVSDWTYTARVDGRVVCVFGLARAGTVLSPIGVPWMLGTPLVARHRRALARLAPRYIRMMLRTYPVLRNLVHADNTVAVHWLRRTGFAFGPPIPHPATGAPFHLFEMTA